MAKSVVENIINIAKVLFWVTLTIFFATLKDEALRTFSIIGVIALTCFFVQFCSCLDMYINCKKKYIIMRDINNLRENEFAKGNLDIVREYTEDIKAYGQEALELAKSLLKDSMWMPKKKIDIMTLDIQKMMKQEYPPL